MADTRTTTTESERRHETAATPEDGVEVFDTNAPPTEHREPPVSNTISNGERPAANLSNNTISDSELRNHDFRTADRTDMGTTPVTTGTTMGQGTNWSMILWVIAIILLIILVAAWIF